MGKQLQFPSQNPLTPEDLEDLDVSALQPEERSELRRQAEALYADLESREPEDEESEEYYAWLEQLDALEDLLEDLAER